MGSDTNRVRIQRISAGGRFMRDRARTVTDSRSVCFQARQSFGHQVIAAVGAAMSRVFHTDKERTLIVGFNPCTRLLAVELQAARTPVSLMELSEAEPESNLLESVMNLTSADEVLLGRAGAGSARCLVAASAKDTRNLSLCRTALERFRVPVTVARLRLLEGVTSWVRVSDAGMTRLSWKDLIQAIIPEAVFTPALSRLARADEFDQISDIELRSPVFIGRRIEDLPLSGCNVVALTRKDLPVANCQSISLELCDVLTVIGTRTAVLQLRESIGSL